MAKSHYFTLPATMGIMLCILLMTTAGSALAGESQFGFRAMWVDIASYSTPQAADKMLDGCRRAKVNVILASVLAHGTLMHKSTHFLHNVAVKDDYDPLAYITAKAHASGIAVHAWYAVYYEGVKGHAAREAGVAVLGHRRRPDGQHILPVPADSRRE